MLPSEKDRVLVHDLMTTVVGAALRHRIEDGEWDVSPTLLVVAEVPAPDGRKDRAAFITEPMTIPPTDVPLPSLLRLIAEIIDVETVSPPERWQRAVGLVLMAEAYSLSIPAEATEDEAASVLRWVGAGNSPADHPWGVETKMVNALDCHGTVYVSEYLRDRPTEDEPQVLTTFDDVRELQGAVPDAMHAALAAISRRIDAQRSS